MRAWLVVHSVLAPKDATLERMLAWIEAAAGAGAGLVIFSEAALTGLTATGDPPHDLALAEPVPGPASALLGAAARRWRLFVGFGLYERAGAALFDSAVLLGPDGDIALHYRRINRSWHERDLDPAVYREGTGVPVIATPFGRVAVVICGDVFDARVSEALAAGCPDILVVLIARGFDDDAPNETAWETSEIEVYRQRVRSSAAPRFSSTISGRQPSAGRRSVERWPSPGRVYWLDGCRFRPKAFSAST